MGKRSRLCPRHAQRGKRLANLQRQIVHGTKDDHVAYEQAVWMADRLKACAVEVELLTLEGAGHGFKGADAEKAEKAMIEFFDKHLKPGGR